MSISRRNSFSVMSSFFNRLNTKQKGYLGDKAPAEIKISVQYLKTLRTQVNDTYIQLLEKFLHSRSLTATPVTKATYKNLHVAIPDPLSTWKKFYDTAKITGSSHDGQTIFESAAVENHIRFVYVYNVAYLQLLEAIDGPEVAVNTFLELFKAKTIFGYANINRNHLQADIQKPGFMMGLLSYLVLDLIFSQDKNIPVESRVKAIALIKKHFVMEDLAKGFNEFGAGYEVEGTVKVTADIQRLIDSYTLETIISERPEDAAQVLLYMLQTNKTPKYEMFAKIIDSINDDNAELILGINANYREGQVICSEALRAWAIEQTGIVNIENYVDLKVLAGMINQEAQAVVLAYAKNNYQLEKEIVELTISDKTKLNNGETPDSNLALNVNLSSNDVRYYETVKRNFRVLTAQLDVSNPVHLDELTTLTKAYNKLSSPQPVEDEHTNGRKNGFYRS